MGGNDNAEYDSKVAICEGTVLAAPKTRIEACTWLLNSDLLPADDKSNVLALRAETWEEVGDLDQAIEDYKTVIELNPYDHDANHALA